MSDFYRRAAERLLPPRPLPAPRPDPGNAWWDTPAPAPVAVNVPQPVGPAADRCPNPNGCPGSLFKPAPNIQARCYTCNWPLLQSGSGQVSTRGSSHVTPARQYMRQGDWRPQHIIGRVE